MSSEVVECIYCGSRKPSTREHIVQDALGGHDVLNTVCSDCNSQLRQIDRALVVESPLSILVRRHLSGAGPESWDVDHTRDGLLLEARLTPGRDSMTLVPQLVFDRDERLIYCDHEDIVALGQTEMENRLYRRLRRAFEHYQIYGPNARKRDHKECDMLKFHPVQHIRDCYRLPSRISCNTRLTEFDSNALMFDMRYLTVADRARALNALGSMDWSKRARVSKVYLGSRTPEIHIGFWVSHVLRAISKIGFNLLAQFCSSTPVNRRGFQRAVEWIVEGKHMGEYGDVNSFGFVDPTGVAELDFAPNSHTFRLVHDCSINTWKMYASFFDRNAAAYVVFPGPNYENWATIDIIAPYDRPMQEPCVDRWYRPLDVRVVLDLHEILPKIPWQTGQRRIRYEGQSE